MTTKIKVEKGQLLTTALKVNPGPGAIDFAMRYVEELTLEHVIPLCTDLVDGYFEEIDDKKVRRCQYCGYYYRDSTKNNSSLTCSTECKTGKDIVLKDYRRKVRNAGKTKRQTYKDKYYAEYTSDGEINEYPFWTSDYRAREYDRKHGGVYSYGDDFEKIVGRALLNRKMGGKKKIPQVIDYDGYKKAKPFAVKISEKQHKTKECITIKRSAADIEADLLERYGEEKLAKARYEAMLFGRGRYHG